MDLPASFIIMLILTIVAFVFAIYFLKVFAGGTGSIPDIIDDQSRADLEMLFKLGDQIAIPNNRKEAVLEQKVIYWLGIDNIFDTTKKLHITVKFVRATDADGETLATDADYINDNWLLYDDAPIIIKPREYSVSRILVTPRVDDGDGKTEKGDYVFNVCISEGRLPASFKCEKPSAQLPENYFGNKVQKILLSVD